MNLESRRLSAEENRDQLVRGLGWFSIGLGLTELLFPRALGRCIGINPRTGLMRLLRPERNRQRHRLADAAAKGCLDEITGSRRRYGLGVAGVGHFLDEENNRLQLGIAAGAVAESGRGRQ